ncbi:hypothetical protein Nepgr_019771 [Nepenthes gracilis]|uniref:Uncharacterized protein n=1 Tax=Nepenthes gracilis TaxID=150966 RepID=A0AAD3SU91_NEPGR|nr:hypothetical protein Nepgr_019771 [Nepenthes gracilis]
MGRTKLAKMVLLRDAEPANRYFSRFAAGSAGHAAAARAVERGQIQSTNSSVWVPHPRTGIYFPEGHDWVMDDVPEDAALPGRTFWLRNTDGVERPDPDVPPDHYFLSNL